MSSETRTLDWQHTGTVGPRRRFTDAEEVFASLQVVVGRKWQIRIVYYLLEDGPMGFSSLKESLDGVSSKMLSESLSTLEAEGIVDRRLLSDRPVRVEYSLTERGAALGPVVGAMLEWGAEYAAGEGQ